MRKSKNTYQVLLLLTKDQYKIILEMSEEHDHKHYHHKGNIKKTKEINIAPDIRKTSEETQGDEYIPKHLTTCTISCSVISNDVNEGDLELTEYFLSFKGAVITF